MAFMTLYVWLQRKKLFYLLFFLQRDLKIFFVGNHLDYRKAKITSFQKFQSWSGWCVKYHNKRNRSKYKLWKQSSGKHSRVTIQCDCFSCSKTSEWPMRTRADQMIMKFFAFNTECCIKISRKILKIVRSASWSNQWTTERSFKKTNQPPHPFWQSDYTCEWAHNYSRLTCRRRFCKGERRNFVDARAH